MCRLPVSTPVLKAPIASVFETRISKTAFNVGFQIQLAPLRAGKESEENGFIPEAAFRQRQGGEAQVQNSFR